MQLLPLPLLRQLIPLLGCLGLLALFVHLGLWQAGKAERVAASLALYDVRSKQAPQAIGPKPMVADELAYAAVTVRGEYEAAQQFYLDNQVENGRPGLHVMTPLKIEGGETRILVNRGWLAWPDRRLPPRTSVPHGLVSLSGIAVIPVKRRYLLMPDRRETWPELWSSLDLKRYAAAHPFPVQPVVIYLASVDGTGGLVGIRPQPENKVMMHKSYAIQWFGMAIALGAFCGLAGFRKKFRCEVKA